MRRCRCARRGAAGPADAAVVRHAVGRPHVVPWSPPQKLRIRPPPLHRLQPVQFGIRCAPPPQPAAARGRPPARAGRRRGRRDAGGACFLRAEPVAARCGAPASAQAPQRRGRALRATPPRRRRSRPPLRPWAAAQAPLPARRCLLRPALPPCWPPRASGTSWTWLSPSRARRAREQRARPGRRGQPRAEPLAWLRLRSLRAAPLRPSRWRHPH